ncbi:MAG: DNA-protecting protein DprA [Phycisphaerae bacterium]|nr:DNA-protecting protein DprA [Phycisphaerae bacterium]
MSGPDPIPRDQELLWLLALTSIPDIGPIRAARLVAAFGSAFAAMHAAQAQLAQVKSISHAFASVIIRSRPAAVDDAKAELQRAQAMSLRLLMRGDPEYPELLRPLPDAPPLLYVRGEFDPASRDRYALAIVGSRACSHYGMEQAGRFASVLASSGITIVSGGARGIDTAAHRAALRAGGRTIVVQACGLSNTYPPENQKFFDEIVAEGRGVVISELPLKTEPKAENFPARNRIVSGLSLGVLVIEAGLRSGSLITARLAAEEHGREVMALPGRVDSPTSRGCLELIKSGGAALVTEPADVIALIESPARHHYGGTHADRYSPAEQQPLLPLGAPTDSHPARDEAPPKKSRRKKPSSTSEPNDTTSAPRDLGESSLDARADTPPDPVLRALTEPLTLDALIAQTGMDPGALRASLTLLEIQGRVRRDGPRFEKISK